MDISSIAAITRGTQPLAATQGSAAEGFADSLAKALGSVNEAQNRAQSLSQRFQLNDPEVTLEETMIALQTANVSFQSMVQVRNRLLSAYHEIMNLQI